MKIRNFCSKNFCTKNGKMDVKMNVVFVCWLVFCFFLIYSSISTSKNLSK